MNTKAWERTKQLWSVKRPLLFLLAAVLAISLTPGKAALADEIPTYEIENQAQWEANLKPGESIVLIPVLWETPDIIQYESQDSAVATVSNSGFITAVGYGTTTITITGYALSGTQVFHASCKITVTENGAADPAHPVQPENPEPTEPPTEPEIDMANVSLEKTSLTLRLTFDEEGFQLARGEVKLLGGETLNSWNSEFDYTSSNEDMYLECYLTEGKIAITSYDTGTTTLTFTINGKKFSLKLKVTKARLNAASALLVKGQTKQLSIKGLSVDGKKVTWKSSRPNIAIVSSSGKVRAKAKGNTIITASVEGEVLGCVVSVTTPAIKKTISRAKAIAKGTYSQPKRMQKGYYDCSSLIWRAYSPNGIRFGASGYAPVAADLAKWCVKNGKVISESMSEEDVNKLRMQPGDLVFATGENNGRYKGIYHVELFTGYEFYGYYQGMKYISTTYANRGHDYGYNTFVTRPYK